jgi:branched-chain amino acid transport system ATP-binding protein
MGSSAPLLAVESLSVSYGNISALSDVSLTVEAGEVVGLVGANGAGKSTLLKAVMGLVKPSSGKVSLRGKAMTGLKPHATVAEGLAYVPEGRRVFPTMAVEENLRVGAPRVCTDLPGRFGLVYGLFPVLEERKKELAGNLSGGQQQLLAIGRALMAKPRMLLIDEPSLGLSPVASEKMVEAVAGAAGSGVGILLAEQNAELAFEVSSRAYVMEGGRCGGSRKSAELADDPSVRAAYLGA